MACVGLMAFAGVMLAVTQTAGAEPFLKPNDRVVFLGDSITAQCLYTRFVQQYVGCRYPELKVQFFNAGWSGNAAGDGGVRLARDVLFLRPTAVVVLFGMNDGGYAGPGAAITDRYRRSMDSLVAVLQQQGIRVLVSTSGCVDVDRRPALALTGENNYNKTLEVLANIALEVAKARNCASVDLFHPMLAFQEQRKARDPKFTMITDGVHPNAAGHLVMARWLLEGLGAEPMPPLGTVNLATGAGQGLVVLTKDPDNAVLETTAPLNVPFWFDPSLSDIVRDCGLLQRLGKNLAVSGLPRGMFAVTLDGAEAGRYSSEALGGGVMLPGSDSALGMAVPELVQKKEENYFYAWRSVRLGLTGLPEDARQRLYDGLMATDQAYVEALQMNCVPRAKGTVVIARAPEGDNLALKKKSACSDPNPSMWNLGLTDGTWVPESGKTFATASGGEFPKHVTVDLEQPAPIEWVVTGVPPFGSTKTVQVWLSADGQAFTQVGSHLFAQKRQERHTFHFSPMQARYVRLVFPDHYEQNIGNQDPRMCFASEVEAYGPIPAAR